MQTPDPKRGRGSPKERVVPSSSARVESPDDRVRQYEFRMAERAKYVMEELHQEMQDRSKTECMEALKQGHQEGILRASKVANKLQE